MKIIIGLGNPGKEYEQTRHNAGFLALDFVREKLNFPDFTLSKKFNSHISTFPSHLSPLVSHLSLVKPHTYMNRSGDAVGALLTFYKLSPSDILVAHDDKDLTLGAVKYTDAARSAGHNGVQSIIDALGTNAFHRVRIGVGNPPEYMDTGDFVLQPFSQEEKLVLKKSLESVYDHILNSSPETPRHP